MINLQNYGKSYIFLFTKNYKDKVEYIKQIVSCNFRINLKAKNISEVFTVFNMFLS